MQLLFAGLAGVVVGATIAFIIILRVYEKRADRDLIERRIRACYDYRESLGNLEAAFEASSGDARLLEQAWQNVEAFCREVRLTGWLFPARVRADLGAIALELEKAREACRGNGSGANGRALQLLCEKYHEVDGLLRRESERGMREFRRLRFLPGGKQKEGQS
jgi:hypothetical protein